MVAVRTGAIITVASAMLTELAKWLDRRAERKAAIAAAKAKARSEARAAALQRRRVAEGLWVEQYNDDNVKRAGKGRRGSERK